MKKGEKQKSPVTRMRTIVKAQASEDGVFWVNGHRVNMLTGWDFRELEYIREEGNITYKREGKKVRYDIDSVKMYYQKLKGFKTA
jgi:hypothetical protein